MRWRRDHALRDANADTELSSDIEDPHIGAAQIVGRRPSRNAFRPGVSKASVDALAEGAGSGRDEVSPDRRHLGRLGRNLNEHQLSLVRGLPGAICHGLVMWFGANCVGFDPASELVRASALALALVIPQARLVRLMQHGMHY